METETGINNITISGVTTNEEVIFDNQIPRVCLFDVLQPRVVLYDISQPVVMIEKCEWLNEF